jgi:hypothetical protein
MRCALIGVGLGLAMGLTACAGDARPGAQVSAVVQDEAARQGAAAAAASGEKAADALEAGATSAAPEAIRPAPPR